MVESFHASPATLVDACYDLICFEPGSKPAWDEFCALFQPQAVLALRVYPEDDAVTVMDLDAYMVKQMRTGMEEAGYSETLLKRTEFIFHDVAAVRVLFEMKFGDTEPHTAIDIFSLVRLGDCWYIASLVSDFVDPGEPLPEGLR